MPPAKRSSAAVQPITPRSRKDSQPQPRADKRRAVAGDDRDLTDLGQAIDVQSTREEARLSAAQLTCLRQATTQAKLRANLTWRRRPGATKPRRGWSVLLVGGTAAVRMVAAKTLARDLGRKLYRLDLGAIPNKYIGETEKNLRRLCAAAEASDAILLFEESDVLFGQRTASPADRDRFVNSDYQYLLDRLEDHPGLVILTSNSTRAVDSAFTRRMQSVIEFPPPSPAGRETIWRGHPVSNPEEKEFVPALPRRPPPSQ